MSTMEKQSGHLPSERAARLVFLAAKPAQIFSMDTDGKDVQSLLDQSEGTADGVALDLAGGYIYWTNMGEDYGVNDGFIERIRFDGTGRETIIPKGSTFTPKQLVLDLPAGLMYWSDREGMRVMRARMDGSDITILVQTGQGEIDRKDETKHCVGIDIDTLNRHVYWTQKGPPNAGKGRIFRTSIDLPAGSSPVDRNDIELLIGDLPEPIDLEIDHDNGFLYWTDRGDPPAGNTLNRASIGANGLSNHEVLSGGLQEGIGLALALKTGHIFTADLGGFVRRFDAPTFDTSEVIFKADGQLTGIAYVDVE